MIYFSVYLLLINATGFLLMLSDKRKAVKKHWRIPERVLIGIAVIGGSVGALIGMHLFRHKTRHPKFFIGIPFILAIQIVLLILIYAHWM